MNRPRECRLPKWDNSAEPPPPLAMDSPPKWAGTIQAIRAVLSTQDQRPNQGVLATQLLLNCGELPGLNATRQTRHLT
jgi:hypothetical protein